MLVQEAKMLHGWLRKRIAKNKPLPTSMVRVYETARLRVPWREIKRRGGKEGAGRV